MAPLPRAREGSRDEVGPPRSVSGRGPRRSSAEPPCLLQRGAGEPRAAASSRAESPAHRRRAGRQCQPGPHAAARPASPQPTGNFSALGGRGAPMGGSFPRRAGLGEAQCAVPSALGLRPGDLSPSPVPQGRPGPAPLSGHQSGISGSGRHVLSVQGSGRHCGARPGAVHGRGRAPRGCGCRCRCVRAGCGRGGDRSIPALQRGLAAFT